MSNLTKLVDPFNRVIDYLRISVTDRCDFRCTYCMPKDMKFLPKKELLSLEELVRMCRIFNQLGVKKFRFTGGEPLVRTDIIWLFEELSPLLDNGSLDEITLTTNASLLGKYAAQLYKAGLRRVNISLDTLDKVKFNKITRSKKFDQVIYSIKTAKENNLHIKINCVAIKGVNDNEVHSMVKWCGMNGFDLTFIEVMPIGDMGDDSGDNQRIGEYWSIDQLKKELETRWSLIPSNKTTGGPSKYYTVKETGGKVGFISPISSHFCDDCNRVRLTCIGELFLCLGQNDKVDFRTLLRSTNDDEIIKQEIIKAIAMKPKKHDFYIDTEKNQVKGGIANRHMNTTGG